MTTTKTKAQKVKIGSGKEISIPRWMTIHHLPEHDIINSESTSSKPKTATSRTRRRRASSREDDGHDQAESNKRDLYRYEDPDSNSKRVKENARNSLQEIPSNDEIHGHLTYLSQECSRLVSAHIDECVRRSLTYSSVEISSESNDVNGREVDGKTLNFDPNELKIKRSTLVEEMESFFAMFRPDSADAERHATTGNLTANTATNTESNMATNKEVNMATNKEVNMATNKGQRSILSDVVSPPTKYDPTLLPVIIVQCYPSTMDRIEMIRGFRSHFQQRRRLRTRERCSKRHGTTSPSVCVLRASSNLVQQGNLLAETLSQCIANDPRGESFATIVDTIQKRQKLNNDGSVLFKSVILWSQSLVEWASFTDVFDSILIILEDPENIPSPTLDIFLANIASLRSYDGVPIDLVIMDVNPGGLGDRLSKLRQPSIHGGRGAFVKKIYLPSPQSQFEIFMDALFSKENRLPLYFTRDCDMLEAIQSSNNEFDTSLVSLGKQLKNELRQFFTIPGSFLVLLHCEEFVMSNWIRLAWLCSNKHSKKIICQCLSDVWVSEGFEETCFLSLLKNILFHHHFFRNIHNILDSQPVSPNKHQLSQSIMSTLPPSHLRNLICALCDWRKKLTWNETSNTYFNHLSSPLSLLFYSKLNEFIILGGEIMNNFKDNCVMEKLLVQSIKAWTEDTSPFLDRWKCPLSSSDVQPRRDIAKALISPIPPQIDCMLVQARALAFQALQCRTLTLSAWYEHFFDLVADSEKYGSSGMNECAFFFATYELIHCGFVRKIESGRREDKYEKVAVVWGSGR